MDGPEEVARFRCAGRVVRSCESIVVLPVQLALAPWLCTRISFHSSNERRWKRTLMRSHCILGPLRARSETLNP